MTKYPKELKLVINDFVSVNHYLAYRTIMKNGKPMAMSYKTKEAKKFQQEFENHIKEQVIIQKWDFDDNPFQHYYVDSIFYFPRIDMDANNYYKCAFDSITNTGLVWTDDNIACERVQRIYYDAKNPRIEYTIHPVDYIGIFDNSEKLCEFEDKCKSCNRYKRNCSILKKAKEGRIQEELDENSLICSKFKEVK